MPVFHDYLKATGGQSMLDEYIKTQGGPDRWFQTPPVERVRQRMGRPNYWFGPGNTLDRATSMIPKLMYERLPDFGIDFAIVYPTLGLGGFQGANRVQGAGLTSDLRRCCVRAYNIMAADMFRAYADRMTPAAIIPTVTPQEGVEEAEYVVRTLGLKVGMLHGVIQRPIPADADWQPDPRAGATTSTTSPWTARTTTTRCGPRWSSWAWRIPATVAAAATPRRAPRPRASSRAASATSRRRTRSRSRACCWAESRIASRP